MRPGAPQAGGPAGRGGSGGGRPPAQPSAAAAAAMSGAVDLAAVKARSEAAARAAEAPPPSANDSVVQVSEASFQADVIDRSFQVPVLIDLWSARSPASAQLSATLQSLAVRAGGQWVLARVDVDNNMGIAQALQVQGIPTVFAVISGQLVPGFQGALPEAQVGEFVQAVLQAARDAGMTVPDAAEPPAGTGMGDEQAPDAGPPALPEDPRFTAAEDALQTGDYAAAARAYEAILATEPANAEAALALGQVRLLERTESLDPGVIGQADAAPADAGLALSAADLEFATGQADAALRRLLDVLPRLAGDDRDPVRERLVEYFDLLGPDDPRVGPARRELARALF